MKYATPHLVNAAIKVSPTLFFRCTMFFVASGLVADVFPFTFRPSISSLSLPWWYSETFEERSRRERLEGLRLTKVINIF